MGVRELYSVQEILWVSVSCIRELYELYPRSGGAMPLAANADAFDHWVSSGCSLDERLGDLVGGADGGGDRAVSGGTGMASVELMVKKR